MKFKLLLLAGMSFRSVSMYFQRYDTASYMRKSITLIIFITFSLVANAQRFSNSKNINLSGGYNFDNGYVIGAGFEKLLGATTSLRINAQYFNSKDEIKSLLTKIDINNILADASFNYYIPLYRKLFFSVGAGGTGGYQFFTFDKPDYVDMTEDNRFVYGFNGVGQLELNISSISLFAEYKAIYLFNSRDRFNHHIATGLKKYF